jgi:hypothetical protein
MEKLAAAPKIKSKSKSALPVQSGKAGISATIHTQGETVDQIRKLKQDLEKSLIQNTVADNQKFKRRV